MGRSVKTTVSHWGAYKAVVEDDRLIAHYGVGSDDDPSPIAEGCDRYAFGACADRMSTGAWYDPEAQDRNDSLCKHGNVNVLTLDKGTSRLAQGCVAHICLVEIERYEGEAPSETAFQPPEIINQIERIAK